MKKVHVKDEEKREWLRRMKGTKVKTRKHYMEGMLSTNQGMK